MSQVKHPSDPGDAALFRYELELRPPDENNPHEFCAVSDEQAVGMMEKLYADQHWTLFRKTGEQRVRVHEA